MRSIIPKYAYTPTATLPIIPIKILLCLLGAVATFVWAYFGIIERLNNIETNGKLMITDVEKNTEFRIKWPRGEMGSLPADS